MSGFKEFRHEIQLLSKKQTNKTTTDNPANLAWTGLTVYEEYQFYITTFSVAAVLKSHDVPNAHLILVTPYYQTLPVGSL